MATIYTLVMGTIGTFLTGWSLYYQHQNNALVRANMASGHPQRAAAAAIKPWWKTPGVRVMVILAALAWVPSIFSLFASHPVEPITDIYKWGVFPNGDLYFTTYFTENKPDRKIMLVAFHATGLVDFKDEKNLQKSELYDYTSGLNTLLIDPDENFRSEAKTGIVPSFILLDIPNTLNKDAFSTIRQAIAMGAKQIPATFSSGAG
jgi:hypothetical protein